ncbi:hypothetical protein Hanom_Chr11g00981711 [Helianthus anomalus]
MVGSRIGQGRSLLLFLYLQYLSESLSFSLEDTRIEIKKDKHANKR